jgi:4-hydroxybenzoate polyprenyltransferase
MLKNISGIYESSRKFPYEQYLITSFPFFAILFMNGFNISFYSLFLLAPFITVMAGLFMYNTICDAPQDPEFKNPITRGDVSEKTVKLSMWACVVLSIFLVLLLYKSYVSDLIFILYLFLSFTYSGLRLRFKETILGPPVASFLLFCAAPLLLLVEFSYFNYSAILLLLGLFIVYFGHEIKHTIIEYDMDKSANCQTFAVVIGKKNSTIIEYLTLIIGFLLILMSINLIVNSSIIIVVFSLLTLIAIISTISYGYKNNYDINKDTFYNDLPYITTKILYIGYACLILNIPELIIFFIIWILFTDKYL